MKSKRILRFAIVRKGYQVDAVESYIAAEQQRADEVRLAQSERISALKDKVDTLTREVETLRGREEQIKAAFITASQDAEKLKEETRERYSAELERLRLFRAKWTKAYEELKTRYNFDKDALNMESVAVGVELELQRVLMQDFSLSRGDETNEMEAYFKSEVERLASARPKHSEPSSPAAKELKERLKAADRKKTEQEAGAAFSLEEALHPTESLEDICKALGIA